MPSRNSSFYCEKGKMILGEAPKQNEIIKQQKEMHDAIEKRKDLYEILKIDINYYLPTSEMEKNEDKRFEADSLNKDMEYLKKRLLNSPKYQDLKAREEKQKKERKSA